MSGFPLQNDYFGQKTPLHKYFYNTRFSPYSTAKRPTSRTPTSELGNSRSQYIYSDTNYMSPEEVYENFNLNSTMPVYIERIIKWFSKCLLQPLASKILYIDNIFDNNGLSHLNCQNSSNAIPFNLNPVYPQQTTSLFMSASSQNQSTPATLSQLSLPQYSSQEHVKQRLSLEKYLSVPNYDHSRKYIVHRILLLASSNFLKEYKWDGGGDHPDTKHWNSSSDPPDSLILFHLFCTFLDETIPSGFQRNKNSFSSKYLLSIEDKPDSSLPFQIIQVVKKPPHFCLVVKNTYYDAPAVSPFSLLYSFH
ncbi:Transmembrane protein [Smittium culicis]|uniref:Transmembrane protein n=2 Tax=Smittium culicis TaxID=133412 RepID=A0A1R1YDT7_9FUNG|nr:Transmembrane protein [Smittium culicis]